MKVLANAADRANADALTPALSQRERGQYRDTVLRTCSLSPWERARVRASA
jgi:hypothetical protein